MSSILSADDLNDFIAPGVACIKPVEIEKTSETAEITIGDDGEVKEEGQTLAPAQISLQDCLACSGCITSSEAMLVELQSPKELIKQLHSTEEDAPQVFVASVCHQTRVSLSKAYNLDLRTIDDKLASLFINKLGFKYLVGTEIGRAISLEESWSELHKRKTEQKGPILSSICPGWTLYAEKTHPEVLEYLSSVRSPQQITGNLVKQLISRETGVNAKKIYHLSIMPCFDKKLEASRPSFALQDGAREVDLVITAKELVDLLQTEFQTNLPQLPVYGRSLAAPNGWPIEDQWKSNVGSSSGGYLGYALEKSGGKIGSTGENDETLVRPGFEIVEIPGKNSDYVEYHVVAADSKEIIFKGAQVYGFRNIQNLVRKLKMKKKAPAAIVKSARSARNSLSDPFTLDYIELMACPGGCVRGGGQIGSAPNIPAKVWTADMNSEYAKIDQLDVSERTVAEYFARMGIDPTAGLLRTSFEAVKPDPNLTAAISVGTQW